MTVAVIALSIALVAVISLVGWQVYRGDERSDQLTKERADHSATTLERDRLRFENEKLTAEVAQLNRTIDAMSKEPDANPNSDLAADDVTARSVRAAIKAKAAAARRTDPVYSYVHDRLHSETAADAPKPAEVQPVGPLDPSESLL